MLWLRGLAIAIGVLALAGTSAYYWLIVESHLPSGSYALDMDEVRRLAGSVPGAKAQEVRFETVGTITFPKTAVVAGDGWEPTQLPVSAYQLVFPDQTAIIDTAYDALTASKAEAQNSDYDGAAYQRIVAALNKASLIVITHEHWDHAATLFAQPNLPSLLKVTKLTREQVDNADRLVPSSFPPSAKAGYAPIAYEHYLPVAPGVVLIKSPGHTPGSQIVYVQRSDGTEFLFVGDVAWHQRNIDLVRERARLVTWWFLKEDREAVMLELARLNELQAANPRLTIVPGHDPVRLEALVEQGLLGKGFQ